MVGGGKLGWFGAGWGLMVVLGTGFGCCWMVCWLQGGLWVVMVVDCVVVGFMATGFVVWGCGGWFLTGRVWVWLLGFGSWVMGVVLIVTWLVWGWFVGWFTVGFLGAGLGVGGGWFSGLVVGLSLVRNGSIGLVVRSLSLVGLSCCSLVFGLVKVCCWFISLEYLFVCTCGSGPGWWFEQSSVVPVQFFLSVPVSVFLSR